MNINKALKLVDKLSNPHNTDSVFIDETGGIVLQNSDGENVSDSLYKELEAIKFKEEHGLVPRKWRSWAAGKSKEF